MWQKMRELTPFHTIWSVSLQLLAWAAFTTTVRSLHFVFQVFLAGQPSRVIIPDCLQFTFYTSTPNVFHFLLASSFLHSWMTIRGMVPAEACLTSYLHVITGGHSTSIPAVPQTQQWWKTYQKWDPCECLPRQACDLLLSFHMLIMTTLKNSSEHKKETQ